MIWFDVLSRSSYGRWPAGVVPLPLFFLSSPFPIKQKSRHGMSDGGWLFINKSESELTNHFVQGINNVVQFTQRTLGFLNYGTTLLATDIDGLGCRSHFSSGR